MGCHDLGQFTNIKTAYGSAVMILNSNELECTLQAGRSYLF